VSIHQPSGTKDTLEDEREDILHLARIWGEGPQNREGANEDGGAETTLKTRRNGCKRDNRHTVQPIKVGESHFEDECSCGADMVERHGRQTKRKK